MGCANCKPAAGAAAEASAGTVPCRQCVAKHLGTAEIAAQLLAAGIQADAPELLARAQVLWSESRNGHPLHLWYAIGCLALAVRVLTVAGQAESAAAVRTAQLALDAAPEAWPPLPEAPAGCRLRLGPADVAAELAEAERELRAAEPDLARRIALDIRRLQAGARDTLSPLPSIAAVITSLNP